MLAGVASAPAGATGGDRASARFIVHLNRGASVGDLLPFVTGVEGRIDALRLVEVEVHPDRLALLRAAPAVDWVSVEGIRHVQGRLNDPLARQQWALNKIGITKGWAKERGDSSPVTVAVVDTGIDASHPDLQGRITEGLDLVNTDDDPMDDHGHGTHIAGVIGATQDNRRGIAGMSWGVNILNYKGCDGEGACADFSVVAGIVHAIQSGAQVVNLSLGGGGDSCPPVYELAARFADNNGVLLVAAAGNSGSKEAGNPVAYPAACDGYLGVGATTRFDEWAEFSGHRDYVDLSAPGVEIMSTLPPSVVMEDVDESQGYGMAQGTSMATPYVVGLAALLLAQNPDWTPSQLQQRMEETSVDLGKRGRDEYFGAGRIDVAAALGVKR